MGRAIRELTRILNNGLDPRNRRLYTEDLEIKHCYEWTKNMSDGHKPAEDVATKAGGHNLPNLGVAYQLSELRAALAVADAFKSRDAGMFRLDVKRRIKVLERIAAEGVLTLPEVIGLTRGLKGDRWDTYTEGDRSIAMDDALDVAHVVHKAYEAADLLR